MDISTAFSQVKKHSDEQTYEAPVSPDRLIEITRFSICLGIKRIFQVFNDGFEQQSDIVIELFVSKAIFHYHYH